MPSRWSVNSSVSYSHASNWCSAYVSTPLWRQRRNPKGSLSTVTGCCSVQKVAQLQQVYTFHAEGFATVSWWHCGYWWALLLFQSMTGGFPLMADPENWDRGKGWVVALAGGMPAATTPGG
ncbi:hypothetical protein ACWGI9_42070 [Streptomyces sp. NPDC054833]